MVRVLLIFLLLISHLVSAQSIDYQIDNQDSSFAKIASAAKDYDIIGMGESAHGIREFHAWEFSFVKYLISTNRLKAVVIEDNFAQAKKISDYVSHANASGNLDSLMGNLYNIWRSKELANLIEFIRKYNLAQKDQKNLVLFMGADMQDASGIYDAYTYLKENNIPVNAVSQHDLALIAALGKGEKYNFKKLPTEDKEQIDKTISFFQKSFDKLSERKDLRSSREFKYALQNFKIVSQCYQNEKAGIIKWITYRNKALAENLVWAQSHIEKGKQVVFMAHNGHLSNSSLRKYIEAKGVKYYAILQDFMSGTVINNYSYQKSDFTVSADNGMLGSYFMDRPGDMFFINFLDKKFQDSKVKRYMKKHNKVHNFGVDNAGSMKIKPGKRCSAIIIYRNVTSFMK